jgi:hypothetical protein
MKSCDFWWALYRSVYKAIIRSISSNNVNAYHLPNLEEEKLLIYMCRYYLFNEWFKNRKNVKNIRYKKPARSLSELLFEAFFWPH